MKQFTSQVCTTIEQSRRLLEMGLKPETADMHHYKWSEGYWDIYACPPRGSDSRYIPAWSLHRLIELMNVYEVILEWKFDIYECAISVLEERIKDGLINKEYLKQ